MSETSDAAVTKRRFSWVWLIPIASLVIAGWLIWTTVGSRGPLISIVFDTAEGLQAGQSPVKFKDIQMGTVEGFGLTKDRKVTMHVRMTRQAEPFLTDGTEFWVVKPRLFGGDITGLNTIISGSYIQMAPGREGGDSKTEFVGLEDPPLMEPNSKGRVFYLNAPRVGALTAGSPVFYRNVEVGKVVKWTLNGMAESVTLSLLIDSPYDNWVHDDSRFWNSSGIAVKLEGGSVRLEVESLKAALLGGVTFETPGGAGGNPSTQFHTFNLYPTPELAEAETVTRKVTLATYLTGSVGGLTRGAPVMLLGFRVGDVTKVDLQYDTDQKQARVRAEFVIETGKVQTIGSQPPPPNPEGWRQLIDDKGLRVHLKGGSIITGEKQLAMEFDPTAPAAHMQQEGEVLIIPSTGGGGGIEDLSSSATQLLDKIKTIPFTDIGRNLDDTLSGASHVVNSPKVQQALDRLNGALADAQNLLRDTDQGIQPLRDRMPQIAKELEGALQQARELLSGLSAGAAGNSRTGRDLDRALDQLAEAAHSIRMLTDLLNRHPEALISGRKTSSAP